MKFDPLRFTRPSARVSSEERARMISEIAYGRAEQRSFEGGHEIEDWLAAEAEVDERLERRIRQI